MNFLTDNHIHSVCSPDAFNTMSEMALASYEKGVRKLCFTDHCELDDHTTGLPDPNCYSFRQRMLNMYEDALRAVPGDMELFLGLELGEGNHDPQGMKEIVADERLDFVLGSLHNVRGHADFFELDYSGLSFCREVLDIYMDELIELSRIGNFDVMAHVGYPVRYMRKKGVAQAEMSLRTHGDGMKTLFRNLVEQGRGIEINCSGLRNKYVNETIPSPELVRLYKEQGGEIITLGSDAHRTADAAFGLREGMDLLRETGFRYVTVFRGRKPEFIKL